MFQNLAHVQCTCNTADWYQAWWFRLSWQWSHVSKGKQQHMRVCYLLVLIVLSKTDPIRAASPKLWYCVSVKQVPYLPLYNARPCIIRTLILDHVLEENKNKTTQNEG